MAVKSSQKPSRGRFVIRGVLLAVALYYALWGGEYSAFDVLGIRRKIEANTAQVAAARAELDSLRAVADRLENDPETIERVARERFGMIRDGEVLYRFVEVDSLAAGGESDREMP